MLVEGGYLHSMKRLMEKAATLDEPARRPPSRISWRSARFVIGLLGGRSVAADLSRADETRRREDTNDSRRR